MAVSLAWMWKSLSVLIPLKINLSRLVHSTKDLAILPVLELSFILVLVSEVWLHSVVDIQQLDLLNGCESAYQSLFLFKTNSDLSGLWSHRLPKSGPI